MVAGAAAAPQVRKPRARIAIERSFDAAEANRIINVPAVLAEVAAPGVDALDVAPFVADPANILLMVEGGAILFLRDDEIGSGIYNLHTNFELGKRGSYAINASLEAYRWMFTRTDCVAIRTCVPASNRAASFAARAAGFQKRFERPGLWPSAKGVVALKFYELTYQRWFDFVADELIAAGRMFHERLEAEFARLGHTEEAHADEDCHDQAVGACVETVYGGQVEKAIVLYNRWARFAGYGQVALVAKAPLAIDIGNALLQIGEHSFKMLRAGAR